MVMKNTNTKTPFSFYPLTDNIKKGMKNLNGF